MTQTNANHSRRRHDRLQRQNLETELTELRMPAVAAALAAVPVESPQADRLAALAGRCRDAKVRVELQLAQLETLIEQVRNGGQSDA